MYVLQYIHLVCSVPIKTCEQEVVEYHHMQTELPGYRISCLHYVLTSSCFKKILQLYL